MSTRTLAASSGLSLAGAAGSLTQRVGDLIALWSERATSRAELRKLDERLLRDIGLDPMTAECESNKPFWQP